MKSIVSAIQNLSKMDPTSPELARYTDSLVAHLAAVESDGLSNQVKRLKVAAEVPAANYAKIVKIASELEQVVEMSKLPGNEEIRTQVASIVSKVAGLFAEVDTASDLAGKSLEAIEKAVHSLYSNGKTNDPATYYFAARGKGHHSKE